MISHSIKLQNFYLQSIDVSSERLLNKLGPLALVCATSNAKIEILFPQDGTPDVNPLLGFRFDKLLPSVSRISTSFSRPAMLARPKIEVDSNT